MESITKLKGKSLKDESVNINALEYGLQKAIPALTGFIKKLNTKEDANNALKIPYCSEVVLYTNQNINILKNGESITYNNYGYELTIKGNQETSDFILEINGSQVDVFEIYLFKGINKIKKEFLPDTIVKTTPQELDSDTQKQILTNLGIPISNYKEVYITEFTFYDIEQAIYNNIDYPISNKLKEAIVNDKLILIPVDYEVKGYIIPNTEIDDLIYLYFTKDIAIYSLGIDASIKSYEEYTTLYADQCLIYTLNDYIEKTNIKKINDVSLLGSGNIDTNICLFYPNRFSGTKNSYIVPNFDEIFDSVYVSNLGYKIKDITKFYNLWSRLNLYITTETSITKVTTPEPNITYNGDSFYINISTGVGDTGYIIAISVTIKTIILSV